MCEALRRDGRVHPCSVTRVLGRPLPLLGRGPGARRDGGPGGNCHGGRRRRTASAVAPGRGTVARMKSTTSQGVICAVLLAGAPGSSAAQQPIEVACSPSVPSWLPSRPSASGPGRRPRPVRSPIAGLQPLGASRRREPRSSGRCSHRTPGHRTGRRFAWTAAVGSRGPALSKSGPPSRGAVPGTARLDGRCSCGAVRRQNAWAPGVHQPEGPRAGRALRSQHPPAPGELPPGHGLPAPGALTRQGQRARRSRKAVRAGAHFAASALAARWP